MQVDVIDISHQKVGEVSLPDDVFADAGPLGVLQEEICAQRARRRRGTHSTKTRADVRGGGAKPYKQKGTGRARQGSNRAPNHVGGGVVFGPHPRDYGYRLPRGQRRCALRRALSCRAREGALVVLDAFPMAAPKTREVASFIAAGKWPSALIVDGANDALQRSARNLPGAKYLNACALNVYDVLRHQRLVVTQQSLEVIIAKARQPRAGQQVTAAAGVLS